tara:strand:+ start:1956 stop:2432 length:477 start_codon:yes stop_codon:yes gene_type:complete
MIKLRADLEKLEKCADEIALGGTNMDSQQLMRDARRDIGLLEREVRELESWRNAFAGAVFELIEPNLNQLLLERPSRVDVMTMRSVVHDMVTDGTILGTDSIDADFLKVFDGLVHTAEQATGLENVYGENGESYSWKEIYRIRNRLKHLLGVDRRGVD